MGTLEKIAPWPFSRMKRSPNISGPAVTGSGLIFIAGTPDECIRAFSTSNEKERWKATLPTGGHANPMPYQTGENGKQYVVITAGGHFGMAPYGQVPGDYIIAYALPDTE